MGVHAEELILGDLALDDEELAHQLEQLSGMGSRADGLEDLATCVATVGLERSWRRPSIGSLDAEPPPTV